MATKDTEELKQELRALQAQRRGLELELAECPDAERQQLEALIYNVSQECDKISKQIAQLETREQRAERKSNWKTEKPAVDQAIDENHIGYIANEDKFIYCRDFGIQQSNVQFKMVNATRIVRVLSKMAGVAIHGKDQNELIDYFQERGASYLDVTSSFNTNKWRESDIYNKMSVIRTKWIEPDYEHADEYNKNFDILIQSICGGKQENIDHLEKWVAFKYLYPGRNANTPNIDMGGNPGGNGKGRFTELLKTIFTPTCVVQAHKEELEKFNANWEMAVILYYDEPEEKELAAAKLKQATGAEDMRVEKKGIDATMADRNYNFLFMSNNQNGVVKLSGGSNGGEDRRYSVMNTDIVLEDLLIEAGFDRQSARAWLNDLAQNLVKNRQEVARWLAHIIRRHQADQMQDLPALHGQDYHNRFEEQKDAVTQAFDAVMVEFQRQGWIPMTILTDFVIAHTGFAKWNERSVKSRWETYLRRNRQVFATAKEHYAIVWDGEELKKGQGQVCRLPGHSGNRWELTKITSRRPIFGIQEHILQKQDLLI